MRQPLARSVRAGKAGGASGAGPNVRLCRLIYDDYQSKRPDSGTATSSQLE